MFYARAIFANSHEATTGKFYSKADRDLYVAEHPEYAAVTAAEARKDVAGRVNHRILFTGKANGRWYSA